MKTLFTYRGVAGEAMVVREGESVRVTRSGKTREFSWKGSPGGLSLSSEGKTFEALVTGSDERSADVVVNGTMVSLFFAAASRSKGEAPSDGFEREVRAVMPGRVARIAVKKGDRVETGASLLVLEAMKMENEIKAPAPAVIETVHVTEGAAVEKGALLVTLEAVKGNGR